MDFETTLLCKTQTCIWRNVSNGRQDLVPAGHEIQQKHFINLDFIFIWARTVPRHIRVVTVQPVADLSALDRCRVTGWMWPFTAVVKAAQSGSLLLLAGQIRLHDYSSQTIKRMKAALQSRFSCNKIWWDIGWILKSWPTDTAKNLLQYVISVTSDFYVYI